MKNRGSFCLLLAVLLLFLTACEKDGTTAGITAEAETEENVFLSNIRFSQDNLSEKERTRMESVIDMLKHAAFRSDTQEFIVSNTTGEEFDEIRFLFLYYNSDDTLIYTDRLRVESWPANERIEAQLAPSRKVGSYRNAASDHLEAAVRFSYGDHYYQTPAVPVAVTEEEAEAVELHLSEKLPFFISFSDRAGRTEIFTVSDVQCIKDWVQDTSLKGQYYIRMIITKDSGTATNGGLARWRIVREEDREMMCSGTVFLNHMHEGEQFLYQSYYFELDPGSYFFEMY